MRILKIIVIFTFTICNLSCSNPFGEGDSIGSSFSPAGDSQNPTTPTNLNFSGTVLLTQSPTLTWTSALDNSGQVTYEIAIASNTSVDDIVSFLDIGDANTYQFTNLISPLIAGNNYYFLLKAKDPTGNYSDTVASISWSPGLVSFSGGLRLPEAPTHLTNCNDYLSSPYYSNQGDNIYWIDPDGTGGSAAYLASCDMTEDSGGWTLILNYVHQGGTNPATNPKTTSLPVIDSSTLSVDESSSSNNWGHAAPALLSLLTYTELRFYCITDNHPRIVDFKTSHAGTISYVNTGAGTANGIGSSFTALSSHNGNIPASVNGYFSNQGNDAFTNFLFYQGGNSHWGIRGAGSRWECDDYPNGSGQDTIHRVWAR